MAADPQPLIDAVKAGVKAAGVACDVGRKPADATTRWVVLWPDPGTVTDRSLRFRDGLDVVLTFHCYGQSPEAALFALRKTRDAVEAIGGTQLGGRTMQPPANSLARPLSRDDDVAPPLWWHHDEWRFRTTP